MQTFVDASIVGLAFWSARASVHRDCWVTFLLNYYSGFDPRCQQWVEPVTHDAGFEYEWVDNVITNFGYTVGGRFSKVDAFNTWQRATYQTNWAFSFFVAYNPVPAPASFNGGGYAFAYIYGPYFWGLFRSAGYAKDQPVSHEAGHIFGACDEYPEGCNDCVGSCSIHGTPNANCVTCNPSAIGCMMRYNNYALCQYTKGMIGWDAYTPCAPAPPAPLPAPSIATVLPGSGYQGAQVMLTITGGNFVAGVQADLGANVFIHSTTLTSASTLDVWASALNEAPPGLVPVTVRNRDGQAATLPGSFEILPTTRHYYSPTGGDVFPFHTPAGAATSLATALDACANGDTLFVPTQTFPSFSLVLDKGVLLHGGWDATFTTRDLVSGKTVLQLNGNVDIYGGVTGAGLDGFIIEGGDGHYHTIPTAGYYGGGVRVLSSTATIANCEIRDGLVGTPSVPGYGGAIYAQLSTVDIRDCDIHDNGATQGGAIYLDQCSGTISGCTMADNAVTASAVSAEGSGVYLVSCAGVAVTNTTMMRHGGGQNGGALLVESSTGVTVDGGVYAYNAASLGGGAIAFNASQGAIHGVSVRRNTAVIGGGIQVASASTVAVSESRVEWNSGTFGTGLYIAGGSADVTHNLLVGNTGNALGAISMSGVSAGSLFGNTLDRNGVASGAGGITVADSPVEVFDNIVANTTGVGITCSGTSPTLSYNLVWNASGGAYGTCTGGTGAIAAAPVFVDTAAGDYHLGVHSPAIDAGRPDSAYADPDGSRGDMGWYGSHVFAMEQPSYLKDLVVETAGGQATLRWRSNPEPDIAQYAVYCDTAGGFVPDASSFVGFVAAPDTFLAVGAITSNTFYRVNAVDADGHAGGYSDEATADPASAAGETPATYTTRLLANVPNPFNPVTTVRFELAMAGAVTVTVHDVAGRRVRTLVSGTYASGPHGAPWNGRDDRGEPVSSGVYFCRLEAGGVVATRKMVLLK
jgi:hypothetical protein